MSFFASLFSDEADLSTLEYVKTFPQLKDSETDAKIQEAFAIGFSKMVKALNITAEWNSKVMEIPDFKFPTAWFNEKYNSEVDFKGRTFKLKNDFPRFLTEFLVYVLKSDLSNASNWEQMGVALRLFYIPTYNSMLYGYLNGRSVGGRALGQIVRAGQDEEPKKKVKE